MQIVIHAPNRLLPPSLKRTAMLQLIVFLAPNMRNLGCRGGVHLHVWIRVWIPLSGTGSNPLRTLWGDRVAYKPPSRALHPRRGSGCLGAAGEGSLSTSLTAVSMIVRRSLHQLDPIAIPGGRPFPTVPCGPRS